MSDLISKKEALKRKRIFQTYNGLTHDDDYVIAVTVEDIEKLPTVEQKHGHWEKTKFDDYKCSVCGHCENTVDDFEQPLYEDFCDFKECNRFCRICGAKMRGDDDGN